MQSVEQVPQTTLTRQERLFIWLRREGKTIASIGREIGLKRNSAWCLLRGERAPTWRVRQLIDLGVPAYLLPRAEDVSVGPKPKTRDASQPAAQ